jgi:hypothetical protein
VRLVLPVEDLRASLPRDAPGIEDLDMYDGLEDVRLRPASEVALRSSSPCALGGRTCAFGAAASEESISRSRASGVSSSSALEALEALAARGELSGDVHEGILRELFLSARREQSIFWFTLVTDAALLSPDVFGDEIRRAYEDGLIPPFFGGYEEAQRRMAGSPEERQQALVLRIAEAEYPVRWEPGFSLVLAATRERWGMMLRLRRPIPPERLRPSQEIDGAAPLEILPPCAALARGA